MRYILQKSKERPGYWVVTDTDNGLVCIFKEGAFNEDQKFTFLDDIKGDLTKVPTILREMTDWLVKNHYELVAALTWREATGLSVRRRREELNLSIRRLAELAGLSKNHIERIEAGAYNYTVDTLISVLEPLGLKLEIK